MLSAENKEIYICGDFNIDFLKIESESSYLKFYNQLSSKSLLPFIIHPSRVMEGQAPSLIDNIFSNNVQENVLSGNIYLTLSEHFSQFSSVVRDKIDIKKIKRLDEIFRVFLMICTATMFLFKIGTFNQTMLIFLWLILYGD